MAIRGMILCAGEGRRLRPLTAFVPKPLVPIGDTTPLEVIATQLRSVLVDTHARVVVNAFHLHEQVEKAAHRLGMDCAVETDLLGTAGGVRNVESLLGNDDAIVWNGDILSPGFPVGNLVKEHVKAQPFATLAVVPSVGRAGNIGYDVQGRVVRVRDHRVSKEHASGDFMGIHLLSSELRTLLPKSGCMVGDVYIPLLAKGVVLRVFVSPVPFSDIGTHAEYMKNNFDWLVRNRYESLVHPTACVKGRVLRGLVGPRARVDGDVLSSVVWADSVIRGDIVDRIVGPSFSVEAPSTRA